MTKQQELQLKNGDEVFVKAFFDCRGNDGDAYVRYAFTNSRGERASSLLAVTSDSVFLRSDLQQPTPKYDPCRLFKQGDKVRIVSRNNRHFNREAGRFHNKIATIAFNEKDLGPDNLLRLVVEGEFIYSDAAYLELVTPVEELEPFFTKKDKAGLWWEVWKRDKEVGGVLVAYFSEEDHPNPKAAAEAECKRLNEKYYLENQK